MVDTESTDTTATTPLEPSPQRTAVEKNLEKLASLCGSNPSEAEKLASATLAMSQKLGDPALIGSSLCLLSRAVSVLRDSREAIEYASKAVEILRPLADRKMLATALNNLGNCHRRMAEPLDAIRYYEEALEIQISIGNPGGIALVHNNLGLAFMRIGSLERAYGSFMHTVSISDQIGNRFMKTVAMSNMADVLIDQGEYETAEQYLEDNLKINRELNRRIGEAYCLWELGRLKIKQGKPREAEGFLRESIALRKELQSSKVGECLFELAGLLENQSRESEAEEILLQAIDLFEENDNSYDLRLARASLSMLRIHMNRLDGVEEPLVNLLEGFSDLKSDQDLQLETLILKALSEYHEKRGNLPEALEYFKRYAGERDVLLERRQQENITKMKLRADFQASEVARELLQEANIKLQNAMERIKSLHGMLPICGKCKKIRKDDGYWEQIEEYISTNSDATFSHSLCPDCMQELYPELSKTPRRRKTNR